MNGPKLTIGMPVYNSETFLRESLESLLNQTYGDFILVISDNASTDGTADICKEYASRDRRIQYHRNAENIGMSPNFNLVAERCQTPYFKWSTADDYWAPTMVEKTLAVIEADPSIALCYPKTTLVNSVDGTSKPYDDNLHMMQDDPIERFIGVINKIGLCNLHLGISRIDAVRKTSLLKSFPGADFNLVAELAIYGKIYELQEYLFFRRFHEESSSWARGDDSHQTRRFHSAKSAGTKMNLWRGHLGHVRSVLRSPVPVGRKVNGLRFLLKRMIYGRRELASELWNRLKPQS